MLAFKATVPLFPNAIAVDAQGDFFIAGRSDQDGLFTSPAAFQAHHLAPPGLHFNPYIANMIQAAKACSLRPISAAREGGTHLSQVETISAIALSPARSQPALRRRLHELAELSVQSYLAAPQLQPFQSKPQSRRAASRRLMRSWPRSIREAMSLVTSTYLGGSGMDSATSVAVDRTGNVYVAGDTAPHATLTPSSLQLGPSDFPTTNPLMPAYTAGGYGLSIEGRASSDGEATFSGRALWRPTFSFPSSIPACRTLEFSTYLGGGGHDVGPQIALDNSGTIHVAGTTFGFPVGALTNAWPFFSKQRHRRRFPNAARRPGSVRRRLFRVAGRSCIESSW